ncbi:MAG: hypothetical protein FJ184_11170 [Gammaproteobacteria bacterium]|nr:hypothetical protein [Gammaproteobacteria bacterium]
MAIYGFGTFGLTNLFHVRLEVQLVFFGLLAITVIGSRLPMRELSPWSVAGYFLALGLGGYFHGAPATILAEALAAIFLCFLIATVPLGHVRSASRVLIQMTAVFLLLVLIAYFVYFLDSTAGLKANADIYDSTVGAKGLRVGHWVDYLSFTSGDGFVLMDYQLPRLKGYTNEPSSTALHYLTPVILALAVDHRRYRVFAVLAVLINLIAFASVVSLVIVTMAIGLSVMGLSGTRIRRWFSTAVAVVAVGVLASQDFLVSLQELVSQSALDTAGLDLFARKSSVLVIRQEGIASGLRATLLKPLGWDVSELGAGAGLLYTASAFGGWLGSCGLLRWCWNTVRTCWSGPVGRHAAPTVIWAAFASHLLVLLFVSGYGWERLPGIVFLALLGRILVGRNGS